MSDKNGGVKMKFGACIHNRAAVFMPRQGLDFDLHRLIDLAVLCEELGFFSVSVGDSFLAKPRWQSIPTMAAIAAKTERIRLLSHILQPHMYNNPVVLAQQLTTLDVISHGRLTLGMGLGNGRNDLLEKEYRTLTNTTKKKRGKLFEETLVVLKKLWTEETVTHHGEFYDLDEVTIGLECDQKPHPPMWIAAGGFYTGEKSKQGWYGDSPKGFSGPMERVAKLGDGWLTQQATPDEFHDNLDLVRRLAKEEYGRGGDAIEGIMNRGIYVTAKGNMESAFDELRWWEKSYQDMPVPDEIIGRWNSVGTGHDCIRSIEPFVDAGVDTLVVCIRAKDPFEQVKRIAEEVIPAFV